MLRSYLRPERWAIVCGLLLKALGSFCELLLPAMLATLLDKAVPQHNRTAIFQQGAVMLLFAVLALLGNLLANRRSALVASRITRQLRHDLFTRSLYLSQSQVESFGVSSLETRLTSDTYHVHQMLSRLQRVGVRAPILLLGGLICTFVLDWRLACILLGSLPCILLLVRLVARRSKMLFRQAQQQVEKLVQTLRESLSGIRLIHAVCSEGREAQSFAQINQQLSQAERRAANYMALSNPAVNLILYTGLAFVLIFGAFLVQAQQVHSGTILAFLTYFTTIANSMVAMTRVFTVYNRGMSSAARIATVLEADWDQDAKQALNTGAWLEPIPHAPALCFKHVSFAYPGTKNVLTDLNFSIPPGTKLGIMGATGSGKSTLLHLLLRLYEPQTGQIEVLGHPLEAYSREQLASLFGVSFQEDFLYRESIRQNVTFARDIDEEALQMALNSAQASDFIAEKDNSLDHKLAVQAANLSGGQRQRLSVARALAGHPSFIILDDAASALDQRTEAALRHELSTQYEGATQIIVSQRLSAIWQADHILYLESGRILAQGNHQALLKSCPAYAALAHAQLGLVHTKQQGGGLG